MIDSHCHLTYIKNIDAEIREWKKKGVKAVVTSALDTDDAKTTMKLRETYPDFVFLCLGLHPGDIDKFTDDELKDYTDFIRQNRKNIVAIGECGIDYSWITDKQKQARSKEIFQRMIEMAGSLKLPLVIHSRNSKDGKESAVTDALAMLKESGVKRVMMHCFSGNESNLKTALDSGYFISFATNVCWTKKHPRLAAQTPLEQMLLETDSPWLDPDSAVDNIKLDNRPWKIVKSAEIIATVKNISATEVLQNTAANARKFFRI